MSEYEVEVFEPDFLNLDFNALQETYLQNPPFPHMVFDFPFRYEFLVRALEEFPAPDSSWWKYDNVLERKYAKDDLFGEGFHIQHLVHVLQSKTFVSRLEKLTGIDGLIVDHTLRGGGLHQIARGGKLDIHADYNVHPVTGLDRRVNVIVYLNKDWGFNWGGNLELWDKDMSLAVKAYAPCFNTMIIFSTNETSYHGHPDPLDCPEGETRKSIALYYYAAPKELKGRQGHSTIYKARPGDPVDAETEELRNKRAKGRLL